MKIRGFQFARLLIKASWFHDLGFSDRYFSITCVLSCISALLFCSCTVQKGGTVRKYYFGFTVVTYPQLAGNCKTMDVKEVANAGFSLGFPSGIALGYNKDKAISLSPDGRIILEVQTEQQFESAKEIVKQLNSIGICIIKSPETQKK